MRGAAAGVALALLTAGCASAKAPPNPDFTCSFTHKSRSVDSLKKLPGPIAKALTALAGGMADRGEYFNAGDVVTRPAPFNRFIRGGEIGEKWFVWYEHGGFAYWKNIVIFGSDPSGTPRVLFDGHALEGDLCAATDKLLDGLSK